MFSTTARNSNASTMSLTPNASEKLGAPGANNYTKLALIIYDYFVLKFMSSIVWRCSTSKVMVPFFRANVSKRHLDIGVGTGYFLEHGNIPLDAEVTLCDLNQNSLDKAKARLGRPNTHCLLHDIFEPLPDTVGPFDSISLLYLLHCLPGPTSRKTNVLKHLKRNITPDGVLFGSTILGEDGNHTGLSRLALRRINRKRRMGNLEDTEREFEEALRKNYHDVKTWTVGAVFLFTARRPIV